ncbi:hypothetical protein LZ30DRAFT_802111 [Colletotrichum cereale]|nr:hypothetical protein LZ30DRAFT_802111 [Colletotrichum cereale]
MDNTNGTATESINAAWALESNTYRIIAIVTVFHALALISVGLRVYVQVWILRAPGLDDYTILLSALCAMGGWSVFIIQAGHGLGKHFKVIDKKTDYVVFQHGAFWQSVISASAALMWLKFSIALYLMRLSTCVTSCAGMVVLFTLCKPFSGYWNRLTTPPPTCKGSDYIKYAGMVNTAFNVLTDIILSTLHVPLLWHLQMKRKLKLYAIGILSLGYFAVAMGIVKTYYQINYASDHDNTFNQSVQFWGFLQLQIGIIAACAPAFRPLVSRLFRLPTPNASVHNPNCKHSNRNNTCFRPLENLSFPRRKRELPGTQHELGEWVRRDAKAIATLLNEGPRIEDAVPLGLIPDHENDKGIIIVNQFGQLNGPYPFDRALTS